ncbi:MAG: helix-turn-helix domain-containing protein [Candidatus Dojkabacteria bacterium]
MNKQYYELGQKIRNFRIRSGKSQMELELEIGASAGSLSRIENGEVNPTKETLMKVGEALRLNTSEIASLQNLEVLSPEQVMRAINTFTRSLEIDEIISSAVDILYGLYPHYNGSVLLLVDEDNKNILRAKAVSQMPGIIKVHELLGGTVDKFPFYLDRILEENEALIVRTLRTGKNYISNKLSEFSEGAMSNGIVEAAAKVLGFKTGITIPIESVSDRIGVILYTKDVEEPFTEYEQKILKLLADQIGIAVNNARIFKQLKMMNK